MTRVSLRAVRARDAANERGIAATIAEQKAERAVAHRASREEELADREAEKARVKFTAADLALAVVVRDQFGWHRVVRVNRVSVTVATAYSWTGSIPLDRVLEFREAKA